MFHYKDTKLKQFRIQKHKNCNKEGKAVKVGGTGIGFFANTYKDKLSHFNKRKCEPILDPEEEGRWEEKHKAKPQQNNKNQKIKDENENIISVSEENFKKNYQILDDGITGNKHGTIHDRTRWKDSKNKSQEKQKKRDIKISL
jgi:hypothetical protein